VNGQALAKLRGGAKRFQRDNATNRSDDSGEHRGVFSQGFVLAPDGLAFCYD
jgi:hypothetical protein